MKPPAKTRQTLGLFFQVNSRCDYNLPDTTIKLLAESKSDTSRHLFTRAGIAGCTAVTVTGTFGATDVVAPTEDVVTAADVARNLIVSQSL